MAEVKSIAAVHQRELTGYEKTIERGMGTFVEVGNALKAIRDKKLYKLTHKTFEAYVQERWGWQKRYAYDLIDSSSAAENVRNCAQIATESQAREVAKAPPEKQAEVVKVATQKAAEEERKPTAKDFKQAREEVCSPVQAEIEYDDFDAEDEPEPEPVAPYDETAVRAFRVSKNRLATLRQLLLVECSDMERQIAKDWLSTTPLSPSHP